MKFIYTGGNTSYFGYDFVEGVATEVTSEEAITKLSHNVFFTEVPDEKASVSSTLHRKPRKT